MKKQPTKLPKGKDAGPTTAPAPKPKSNVPTQFAKKSPVGMGKGMKGKSC